MTEMQPSEEDEFEIMQHLARRSRAVLHSPSPSADDDGYSGSSLPSTPRARRHHHSFRSARHAGPTAVDLIHRLAQMRLAEGGMDEDGGDTTSAGSSRSSSPSPEMEVFHDRHLPALRPHHLAGRWSTNASPVAGERLHTPSPSSDPHHRSLSCRVRARRPRDLVLGYDPPRRRTYSMPTKNRFRRKQKTGSTSEAPPSECGNELPTSGDDDYIRIRTFSTSSKGIINRGDSFKRKTASNSQISQEVAHMPAMGEVSSCSLISSHPGSLLSMSLGADAAGEGPMRPRAWSTTSRGSSVASCDSAADTPHTSRVLMAGSVGVGKSSLLAQFMTSEYMGNADIALEDNDNQIVPILLDGIESTLEFVNVTSSEDVGEAGLMDGYIIVYAVNDRDSYDEAIDSLHELRKKGLQGSTTMILVANKGDIVRGREITEEEGKKMATRYNCKYIEVSAVLNHKVDELLGGVTKQIRFNDKRLHKNRKRFTSCIPSEERGCMSPARGIMGKLFKRNPYMFRSCDNLLVL